MTERGAAEIIAGEYNIRWTDVTSARLDSKALKAVLAWVQSLLCGVRTRPYAERKRA